MPDTIDHKRKKKPLLVPKEDTHPGPGLQELDNKVEDIDARDMLGEGD